MAWPWVDRRLRVGWIEENRRGGGRATIDLEIAIYSTVCVLVDLSSCRASLGLECLKSLSLSSFVALIFTAFLSTLIVNTALSSCVHTNICISSFGPMRVVAWKWTFLNPYMKKDGGRKMQGSRAGGVAKGQTFHTSLPSLHFPSWEEGPEAPRSQRHKHSTDVPLYTPHCSSPNADKEESRALRCCCIQ